MPRHRLREFHEESASLLLCMLLVADLAFVAMHLIHSLTQYFASPLLNIETDKGYAEMFQYLKYLWIMMLLFFISIKERSLFYFPFFLLFAYFLVDDALQLHEVLGKQIGEYISFVPPFRLRHADLGEIIVSSSVGLILLPALLAAYWFAARTNRKIFHDLLLLIFILVIFGVGVDMVHIMFSGSPRIELVLGIIEDGGEMLAVSLLLWYVFLLLRRLPGVRAYLLNLLIRPSAGDQAERQIFPRTKIIAQAEELCETDNPGARE